MPRCVLLVPLFLGLTVNPIAGQGPPPTVLFDFQIDSPDDWFVVNDGVMGGRSFGALGQGEAGVAVFEGTLSLENNGGFTTVRSVVPASALAGASRMLLRVRGDGKRYQLRLRPGRSFDGVAWAASFETTAGEWTTVGLPMDAFQPTFRGYRPRGMGPLDPADVRQIGIMLTDKQEGPFRLEIAWIGLDRDTRD